MDRAVSWRGWRRRALAVGVATLAGMGGVAVVPVSPTSAAEVTAFRGSHGPPSHLSLHEGNLWGFVFTGGSASTGYSWRFRVTQAAEVVRISRTVVGSPNRTLVGQPDLEVLAVAAMRPGQAVLTAGLVPPGQDTAVETHVIHIVVVSP